MGSVHRAYRDIPHKWARSIGPTETFLKYARSIGPTGLIPADHGDKRGRYVLMLLFLYCWALERLRAGSGPRAGRSKAKGQNPGNEDRKFSPGKSTIFILGKCFLGLWASLPFFQAPNEASNGPRGCLKSGGEGQTIKKTQNQYRIGGRKGKEEGRGREEERGKQ